MQIRRAFRSLASDRTSGPAEIGRRAARLMREWARQARLGRIAPVPVLQNGDSPKQFPPRGEGTNWRRTAESLTLDLAIARRSTAAPLLLANEIFVALEALAGRSAPLTRKSVAQTVEKTATRFLRRSDRGLPRMRRSGTRLIRSGSRVVTYSASSSVEEVLRWSHRRGKRIEVSLSESRPAREGIELARRLARSGIPVTLSTDAALFQQLRGASLLLIGADAVSSDGVINKVGTSILAEIAAAHRVPVVVVAGPEKFLPPALAAFISDGTQPQSGLRSRGVRGIRPLAQTLDVTPFDKIGRFLTAWGILSRAEAVALPVGLRCSSRLQRMLVSRLGRPGKPAGGRGPSRRHR